MMAGRRLNPIEGEVFAVDKPLGWTSFDVVKRVRAKLAHRLGMKKIKVGHAGTLDPLATGVLVVCTGRATKRIDELQAHVKEYVATLEFGATTSTLRPRSMPGINGNISREKSLNVCCASGLPEPSNRCRHRFQPAKSTGTGHIRWPERGMKWN